MLRYKISRNQFDGDNELIHFNNISVENYGYSYNNALCVNFICDEPHNLKAGDYVKIVASVSYWNDLMNETQVDGDVSYLKVSAVDEYTNTFTVIASKYKTLSCYNAYIKEDNGQTYWYFDFTPTHHYISEDTVRLYIIYNNSDYLYIDNGEIIDCETIRWAYDANVPNAESCKTALFGDSNEGVPEKVKITRPQVKWDYYLSTANGIDVYVNRYKVNINIPIEVDTDVRLNSEENIREYFIEDEKEKSINKMNEMEKRVYSPVIYTGKEFNDIAKINFNLHLREHSGADWTVENDDDWNFSKYGYDTVNDDYYSYSTNKSNQSDLLTYLNFTNQDVKYQKNKLKKSFLRLLYYDSMNPGSQNLLGYSTIFFNTGKLYSKFMSNSNSDIYVDESGDEAIGARVDREIDRNRLFSAAGVSTMSDDKIEEYRISSQLSVQNKFTSNNSSEGFYLYLWADNDSGVVPETIYMKAELNHAGCGRTIPFMAPFWDAAIDNKTGFKTNNEIRTDWSNGDGYGIQKYLRYSYVKFKYKYDKDHNRHIYYPDPERYGEFTGNILNINLYEARIKY